MGEEDDDDDEAAVPRAAPLLGGALPPRDVLDAEFGILPVVRRLYTVESGVELKSPQSTMGSSSPASLSFSFRHSSMALPVDKHTLQ